MPQCLVPTPATDVDEAVPPAAQAAGPGSSAEQEHRERRRRALRRLVAHPFTPGRRP